MTEPTYPCPKCGSLFPMSTLHAHWPTCQGRPAPQQQIPQFPNQFGFPQPVPQYQNQMPLPQQTPQLFIPPPKPEHKHRWSENNTYKVCIAYLYDQTEECREIKVKLRGSWQIFVRYGLKLFVIELIIAFAVAFSLASAIGIRR